MLPHKGLRNLDVIVPNLHELGARHVTYGVRPSTTPWSARS
jgi:hypothetical protein